MALPGETGYDGTSKCEAGHTLELGVLRSAAGYYIGTQCQHCGPWSRESGYYEYKEDAERELHEKVYFR